MDYSICKQWNPPTKMTNNSKLMNKVQMACLATSFTKPAVYLWLAFVEQPHFLFLDSFRFQVMQEIAVNPCLTGESHATMTSTVILPSVWIPLITDRRCANDCRCNRERYVCPLIHHTSNVRHTPKSDFSPPNTLIFKFWARSIPSWTAPSAYTHIVSARCEKMLK